MQTCDNCSPALATAGSVGTVSFMPLARMPLRTSPPLGSRAVLPDDRPPIA